MWNRHLDEFKNLEEIHTYYSKALGLYQGRLFPMEECADCRYRDRWGCQGGCITHAVMKHGELSLEDKPEANGWQREAVLALSPEVKIQRYDVPAETYSVLNQASGCELEVDAMFQPLLNSLNGHYSAPQVIDRYVESTRNSNFQSPLQAFTEETTRQGANELLLGLLHQGFVVQRPL